MINKLLKSEKALSAIISVEIISLIFIVFVSAYILIMHHSGQENLKKATQLRYKSYLLADQLRQSSDDLTRMVRSYTATGNSKFENYFFDILDIRDGKKPRPINYERVYWDFMTTKNPVAPSKKGETVSLNRLMMEAGFTEKEFQLLSDANNESDKLVALEQIAMHAMKGEYLDDKNNFTIIGKPDPEMAKQIVFGDEYHEVKTKIMRPINDFFKSINQRTSQNVSLINSQVRFYNWSLIFSFFILILNGLLLLLTTRKHQKLLVDELNKTVNQLSFELAERKQAEEQLEKSLHDQGERVKEIQCMYSVTESIQRQTALEEIFQDVAELIPLGWHYPEITRGKVTFDGEEYVSEPFEETEWTQSSDIIVHGKPRGSIEVYYLEECPELDEGPFMTEKRDLINGMSRSISEAIERKQAEELLRRSQKMEAIGQLGGGDSARLQQLAWHLPEQF